MAPSFVPVGGGGGVRWVEVRRTTDAAPVNNSTALVTDDTLRFDVVPGVYEWELWVHTTAPSVTSDLKLSFDVPTGTTGFRYELGPAQAASSAAVAGQWEVEDITPGSPGAHQNIFGLVDGIRLWASLRCPHMTVTQAGEFTTMYAQGSAVIEDTVVKAGSFVRYRKIG